MPWAIPKGLTPLDHVLDKKGMNVNVMGVVVDLMPAKPSRGTDWVCTFSITDCISRSEGIRVRYFGTQQELPPLTSTGNVVLLRNIQAKSYFGSDLLLSNRSTTWQVIHASNIPETKPKGETKLEHVSGPPKRPSPFKLTAEDMAYAIDLCNSQDRSQFVEIKQATYDPQAGTTGSTTREKFLLIRDICAHTFYDLVGQVVKTFSSGERLDLYITDYTSNPFLFDYGDGSEDGNTNPGQPRYGDEYGYLPAQQRPRVWQGPHGQRTLQVTLFQPHASYASRKVREGDMVRLRNVHVKLSRDGVARLEGVLHEDKKFPDKIEVQVVAAVSDEHAKEVLKRKREYEMSLKPGNQDGNKTLKLQADDGEQKLTKGQKKQRKKKEKDKVQAPQPQPTSTTRTTIRAAYLECNSHISTIKKEQPTRTVAEILDASITHAYTTPKGNKCTVPFNNIKSRATVRVVDFKPDNIEDFAVKLRLSEYDGLSDADSDSGNDSDDVSVASVGSAYPEGTQEDVEMADVDDDVEAARQKHKWTWRFALLLEDAYSAAPKTEKDRMIVYVCDDDAAYLLNIDPKNLRRSPHTLAQLREKLFILWGELEEQKTKRLAEEATRMKEGRKALEETDGNGQDKVDDKGPRGSGPDGVLTKAFECCIKEYGVKDKNEESGWHRNFKLFGTRIH